MMRTLRSLLADPDFQELLGLLIGFAIFMVAATLGSLSLLAH